MAFNKHGGIVVFVVFAVLQLANAGDPNILTDFLFPPNVTAVDANFFTYTGFRVLVGAPPPPAFNVLKATKKEFPSLEGQSVSYAVLQFPAGTINPLHSHPRSTELLFLLQGTLEVGLIDTTNTLYTQTLQAGDMFVFPKGLVHYQYNADSKNYALAASTFASASAGTVSVPNSVFTSGIDDTILATSFKTDVSTIETIKAGLKPKA